MNDKTLSRHLLELCIIALGVFIGTSVSDWNTQRQKDMLLGKRLNYLVKELKENETNLDYSIRYHEKIGLEFDTIYANLSDRDLRLPYFQCKNFQLKNIPGWAIVGMSKVENAMYENLKERGFFQQLDMESLDLLTKTYQIQVEYLTLSNKVTSRFLGINSRTKTAEVTRLLEILKEEVLDKEKELKKNIKQMLVRLE